MWAEGGEEGIWGGAGLWWDCGAWVGSFAKGEAFGYFQLLRVRSPPEMATNHRDGHKPIGAAAALRWGSGKASPSLRWHGSSPTNLYWIHDRKASLPDPVQVRIAL